MAREPASAGCRGKDGGLGSNAAVAAHAAEPADQLLQGLGLRRELLGHRAPGVGKEVLLEEDADRVEAAPVDLARAMPSKGVQVVRSRVTLVAIESIAGIALVQRAHLSVARRLCQNRGG